MPPRSPATTGDKYQRSLKGLVCGRTLDELLAFRWSLTLVYTQDCIVFLFERLGRAPLWEVFVFFNRGDDPSRKDYDIPLWLASLYLLHFGCEKVDLSSL